ncbi:TPA: hypothetical protein DEQ95_02025 [Candidatus Beckwithbacteria bacterium]|nr:MAG: hypothetical protein UY43_C0001G0913 [Candidatus Beckwithbacteria bacterium GW2011_GWC1_49_16]AQS30849.1 hypothetical protein [uncultured bacterium]KKU36034.1 MAG: hypothetical protein UX50_C0001G0211 [Candidatus Beckwithbacteria bacterium GW2011_GWA1_46_30]KKU72448.1 MAG: hypothetical protein UX97_C0001G0318 [Candidatus Beckwithbacteria bacterium GW2011_GWA2_47_25]KKW04385.1 MAG: hypothetical protein UY37_C0003G0216 [Candidatus Beckwithbacteria bacterium GW2011_GWC2_49_11]OGD49354.1 M
MAKRRTREQKIKAKQRLVYSLPEAAEEAEEVKAEATETAEPMETNQEQRRLVLGDLKRTGVIFLVMLALLAAAYWFLNITP